MSLKRTVAPTELPISIEEVQDHIRWEAASADEAALMIYIRSAVEQMDGGEGMLNRAIVTQTWEWKFYRFPTWNPVYGDAIHVPLPPLQSVSSLKYIDSNGVEQTLAASKYKVLNINTPTDGGLVEPASGESWPSTRDEGEAVTLTFVAGYGLRDKVPEHIRHLLLFTIQDAYDRRAAVDAKSLMRTPAYQGLFDQARYLVVA